MKSVKEILNPILVLFTICAVAAILLALTNEVTADIVARGDTERAELEQREFFPEALKFESGKAGLNGALYDYTAAFDKGGELLGYSFVTNARGYGGDISLICAVEADGVIKDVKILSINETPGLGMRAADESFLSQYEGKKGKITLSSGENGVDAISGATVTSRSITQAVNIALELYSIINS